MKLLPRYTFVLALFLGLTSAAFAADECEWTPTTELDRIETCKFTSGSSPSLSGRSASWRTPTGGAVYYVLVVLHGLAGPVSNPGKVLLQDILANHPLIKTDADSLGVLIVAPDAAPTQQGDARAWNAGACCAALNDSDIQDDVRFVNALVDHVLTDGANAHGVTRNQVSVIGLSNGAMLAYSLQCRAANDGGKPFRSIAAVAGVDVMTLPGTCNAAQAPLFFHGHGVLDNCVKFNGGDLNLWDCVGTGYSQQHFGWMYPAVSSLNLAAGALGCTAPLDPTSQGNVTKIRSLNFAADLSQDRHPGCPSGTRAVFKQYEDPYPYHNYHVGPGMLYDAWLWTTDPFNYNQTAIYPNN